MWNRVCWGVCVGIRVCACTYALTKVRITQVKRVWLLCGTEINSCRYSKWHDNQSPPHHHLPPVCQFFTAHPSVAMRSFNTEQERKSGMKMGKRVRRRKLGHWQRLKPSRHAVREVNWSLSEGKDKEIYTGGILVTPVQTTLQHPGLKHGPARMSHLLTIWVFRKRQKQTKKIKIKKNPQFNFEIKRRKQRQLHSQCVTDLETAFLICSWKDRC